MGEMNHRKAFEALCDALLVADFKTWSPRKTGVTPRPSAFVPTGAARLARRPGLGCGKAFAALREVL
jgi:hypothetical protein